jgi:hypothetical protein
MTSLLSAGAAVPAPDEQFTNMIPIPTVTMSFHIRVPKERSVESQDRTCRSPGWSRRMRATLLRGDPARHPTLAFGPQRQRLRIRPPTSKRYPPHVPADATGSRR